MVLLLYNRCFADMELLRLRNILFLHVPKLSYIFKIFILPGHNVLNIVNCWYMGQIMVKVSIVPSKGKDD